MKALIYNSGLGKRMGELTKNNPKSMVKLLDHETIFERQLRLLNECGINEVVVTTGPFKEQIMAMQNKFPTMKFTFVENSEYQNTNYIYSMYLARKYLDDDFILLHGDLVFNKGLLLKVLNDPRKNLITINRKKELPEKDFKGRIENHLLREVSINIFDSNCFALQPMYKLDKESLTKWVNKVEEFINNGINTCYAENALNEISNELNIEEFSYEDDFIDEIDNKDDLERVSNQIRYFDYKEREIYYNLNDILKLLNKDSKLFIVSDKNLFNIWPIKNILDSNNIQYTLFSDFKSNPDFDDIKKGISLFRETNSNIILSIGGGSSIDTAKVIKLFSKSNEIDIDTKINEYSYIKHICIPTTAGTGAESTRFAVCYYKGKKYSIEDENILPEYVILDGTLLKDLPVYQKKCTIMDALSQSIESIWSVNANEISLDYAISSIKIILENIYKYINNNESLDLIIKGSNLSGKAINISKTTASHAMSYKITSLYNIPHGHAVALTIPYLWEYLENNCNDEKLREKLNILNNLFSKEGYNKYLEIFNNLELIRPTVTEEELNILINSVNLERLKNTPIDLSKSDIEKIYRKSLIIK